jgi:hypothetical protein
VADLQQNLWVADTNSPRFKIRIVRTKRPAAGLKLLERGKRWRISCSRDETDERKQQQTDRHGQQLPLPGSRQALAQTLPILRPLEHIIYS